MKALLLTGITLAAAIGAARNATAQIGIAPPLAQLHDSASTRPLFAPRPVPLLIADSARLHGHPIHCPMPVFALDRGKQDRMPVSRPNVISVERMPVAKDACVNPLQSKPGP